jgi:transcriptional regulator with XRE-family HTH domain
MVNTVAGEALRVALVETRVMSQAELARRIGVSQPTVSDWANAKIRPEAHHRQAVERVLGIPADGWMTDAERAVALGPG